LSFDHRQESEIQKIPNLIPNQKQYGRYRYDQSKRLRLPTNSIYMIYGI